MMGIFKWLASLFQDKTAREKLVIQLARAESALVEAKHSQEDWNAEVTKQAARVARLKADLQTLEHGSTAGNLVFTPAIRRSA